MDKWEFHPTYVQPFYLKIGWTLLKLEEAEQQKYIQQIQSVLDVIEHEEVINLFTKGGWRARNSLGFLLAYANWNQYIPQIGESMLKHPHYTSMYCFSLARFGKAEGIHWLKTYLAQYMTDEVANDFINAGRHDIDSTIVALEILDQIHHTNHAKPYVARFDDFVSTYMQMYKTTFPHSDLLPWYIDKMRIGMRELITFAEKNFDV